MRANPEPRLPRQSSDAAVPIEAPARPRALGGGDGGHGSQSEGPVRVCVVTNPNSWFMPHARRLVRRLGPIADALLLSSAEDVPDGNHVAFFLSYDRRVAREILARSRHNIVVHASALPKGKGMSPLTWQILEGQDVIPLTLFEAVEALDAGPIYLVSEVRFDGSELLPQMRARVGPEIVKMSLRFVREYQDIVGKGRAQAGAESRYRVRTPEDSRLDPNQTIAAQFNLLRVIDNHRYPAFFDLRGHRYVLSIRRAKTVDR